MSDYSYKKLFKIFLVFVSLYIFLLSIGLMSAAFKGFGKGVAEALINTTSNPFVGLFIGILATSIIQSSSTTTSILVGLVASGMISITNAIPIVMGANIGTTVTNTLVSLGHITRREEFKRAIAGATVHDFFNLICVGVMFPLELATGFLEKAARALSGAFANIGGIKFTSPIKTITKPVIDMIKHFCIDILPFSHKAGYVLTLLISVALLFGAMYSIVRLMRALLVRETEVVLDNVAGEKGLLAILAGFILTCFVQSSSITTSLLVPLIGAGVMTVEVAFPITMGANIGTTTTAILASFATGNISAITIAFVHFLFNFFGVVCIYPVQAIRNIPIRLAKGLGNLAFRRRRYAIIYVVGVFFAVPGLLILLSRIMK